ncbi:hypothetical protein NPIL_550151 [Nephila pilipes]|uniref:Uncharacterized protein n=1 Tax=Nephila pilipes TaxID=299642 RepID=A0A8X6U237_NEPPI|nr:hypothetical protein NPIL_272931 [Nephila pilipes]GFT67603.1 hypothetical protein NPIL_221041 [Nephila pilipes]GFT74152.1 hypothetical protein NPIL_535511 [Nephila pilipes]GFT85050.1 hypothetical protein NPIL_550151 [Nephila pilipes]
MPKGARLSDFANLLFFQERKLSGHGNRKKFKDLVKTAVYNFLKEHGMYIWKENNELEDQKLTYRQKGIVARRACQKKMIHKRGWKKFGHTSIPNEQLKILRMEILIFSTESGCQIRFL